MDVAVFIDSDGGVRVLDELLSDASGAALKPGRQVLSVPVPPLLNVGTYFVGVWFGTGHVELLAEPNAATFSLHGSDRGRPSRALVLDLPMDVTPVPGPDAPRASERER
jgi:ABC-2 type transport system ATP-binding protein/lipopolysaccharide transport system ATP-binding protein